MTDQSHRNPNTKFMTSNVKLQVEFMKLFFLHMKMDNNFVENVYGIVLVIPNFNTLSQSPN